MPRRLCAAVKTLPTLTPGRTGIILLIPRRKLALTKGSRSPPIMTRPLFGSGKYSWIRCLRVLWPGITFRCVFTVWEQPDTGSRMSREVDVRFWESAAVRLRRATQPMLRAHLQPGSQRPSSGFRMPTSRTPAKPRSWYRLALGARFLHNCDTPNATYASAEAWFYLMLKVWVI
jgi:hypothetical protein